MLKNKSVAVGNTRVLNEFVKYCQSVGYKKQQEKQHNMMLINSVICVTLSCNLMQVARSLDADSGLIWCRIHDVLTQIGMWNTDFEVFIRFILLLKVNFQRLFSPDGENETACFLANKLYKIDFQEHWESVIGKGRLSLLKAEMSHLNHPLNYTEKPILCIFFWYSCSKDVTLQRI